jgi:hypothetical protein
MTSLFSFQSKVLCLIALITLAGCGGPDPLTSPTAARLRGLANMYLSYAVAKNGGGPANEEVLKKYLHSVDAIQLETSGIDPKAIDSVFISERDQQPFVVLYGQSFTRITGDSQQPLAYEKTGKNGRHLIAYINAKVDHVDDAKLKELLTAKESSPTPK